MTPWLYLTVGLPTLAQGYIVGLLSLTLGLTHRPSFEGPVLVTQWRPWFEERWNYTTTIGAWQGRATWFSEWTAYHENVHLRTYVDLNALGAVQAALLIPVLGWWSFLWWGLSGALWLLPSFLTSIIRYKRRGVPWLDAAYYLAAHEQHAYAATEVHRGGKDWRWLP